MSVLHEGKRQAECQVLIRDGGSASFGAKAAFPVGRAHLDGSPVVEATKAEAEDFAGSWNLVVKKVTFDAAGNAAVQASLDEHAPGTNPVHQDVAMSIKTGEHATIHGANGDDYLLSIHHVIDQAS